MVRRRMLRVRAGVDGRLRDPVGGGPARAAVRPDENGGGLP